jgi:hypothetical protein
MAAKAATKSASKTTTKTTVKTAATKPAPKAKTTLTPDPAPSAPPTPQPIPYPQSPVLDLGPAIVVLVLNAIVIPGLGTIVGAIMGKHKMIGRGVAQFFLAIVVVGWVWGIITGVQCLVNANRAKPATA